MITFSVFLQDNERKKQKAAEKIKSEKQFILEKEEEISNKKRHLDFLNKKAQRIELKKRALMKYEDYLETVKSTHSDEFTEIKDILDRYDTLVKENEKLDSSHQVLEHGLNDKKDATTKYIKDKSTEIMKLNNDISVKKAELEEIIDQQNSLKAEAEEISSKKLGKVSELAQILMAIDNIEQKCSNRQGTKVMVKHQVPAELKPKNFDDLGASVKFAKLQIAACKNYLFDYIEIHKNVQDAKGGDGDKEIHSYLQELKNNQDLI